MLDAMAPAAEAARDGLYRAWTWLGIARAAADAAERGAASTTPMLATKGRASYLGQRSIGHQLPRCHLHGAAARRARRDADDLTGGRVARAVLMGQGASPGTGIGRALQVADRRTGGTLDAGPRSTPPDRDEESRRIRMAAEAAARELEALAAATAPVAGADAAAILEAQALLARDPALLGSALEQVGAGATAEAAMEVATDRQAALLAALDDPLFQARVADVRDVGGRIRRWLSGGQDTGLWHVDGALAVLIADDLLPSEVAVRPARVAGLALAGGSLVGHTAVVARALEIPLVVGLGGDILRVDTGARVMVDGTQGSILVEPDADE